MEVDKISKFLKMLGGPHKMFNGPRTAYPWSRRYQASV